MDGVRARLTPGPPYGYGSRPCEDTREAPGIAAAPGDVWVKDPWVRRAAPLRTAAHRSRFRPRSGLEGRPGEGPSARAGDSWFRTVPITTPGPGAAVGHGAVRAGGRLPPPGHDPGPDGESSWYDTSVPDVKACKGTAIVSLAPPSPVSPAAWEADGPGPSRGPVAEKDVVTVLALDAGSHVDPEARSGPSGDGGRRRASRLPGHRGRVAYLNDFGSDPRLRGRPHLP